MKRVKNKIVKIFSSIGLALFTFGTKVIAAIDINTNIWSTRA